MTYTREKAERCGTVVRGPWWPTGSTGLVVTDADNAPRFGDSGVQILVLEADTLAAASTEPVPGDTSAEDRTNLVSALVAGNEDAWHQWLPGDREHERVLTDDA